MTIFLCHLARAFGLGFSASDMLMTLRCDNRRSPKVSLGVTSTPAELPESCANKLLSASPPNCLSPACFSNCSCIFSLALSAVRAALSAGERFRYDGSANPGVRVATPLAEELFAGASFRVVG